MIIKVLSAIPSAGKTREILEHILATDQKAVIASISRQLSQQSYDFFTKLGGEGILIDSDHACGLGSVNEALKYALKHNKVIFVTHSALFNFTDFKSVKKFNLYIDEVPDLIKFNQYNLKSNKNMVLKYCMPVGEGSHNLILNPDKEAELTAHALEGFDLKDDVNKMLFPIYKSLLQGIPVKAVNSEYDLEIQLIEDRSCQEWTNFNTVTIACNNLYDTFTGMVMQHINKWVFVESPLVTKLSYTTFPNSSRVKIHVMYENDWSKYAADKFNQGSSNFALMCEAVKNNSKDFIYTVNKDRGKISGGIHLSYNPHGLNSFNMFTDAFVAFSFNPQPWQIPLLENLAKSYDLEPGTFVKAYITEKYLEPAFQLCSRTNIRDGLSCTPINLYVPDERCATYIKQFMPDAELCYDLTIRDEVIKKERKKPKVYKRQKTFDNLLGMDEKERRRFSDVKRKLKKVEQRILDVNNDDDMEFVKNWLTKNRLKHQK